MQKDNYIVGLVQHLQTEDKPFLACWSQIRQASLEQDGWEILTIRFVGLDRNHARNMAELAGGCEL